MTQKLVVGLLVLTVLGAVIVGVRDASRSDEDVNSNLLANSADVVGAGENVQTVSSDVPVVADTQTNETQASTEDTTTTQPAATTAVTNQTTAGEPVAEQAAVDMVGESWTGSGSISALDDNGLMLALSMAEVVYVELGPPTFWQSMDVTLNVGDFVTVNGFYNGEQYHAATVTTNSGEQMALRTELGQPLWAGNNSTTHTADGTTTGTTSGTTGEPQVAADEWITVEGVVTATSGSLLTMETIDGDLLDLQLGQQNFVASQGITFAIDDPISVLGYWQGTAFKAGEITKTATGERLMLLDPNGRPLWGGPGRNGANVQTTTQTQTNETAQTQAQNSNQGQGGQGQGSQGQGGQGQGGQGQGNQRQDVQVPATQWETVEGTVTLINDLALTLALDDDSEAIVGLGEVDFWTDQGFWFEYNERLQVDGYWVNGTFQAGIVYWAGTDYEITIRDEFGRLLWTDTNSTGQGQGGQGQGGGGSGGGGNGYQGGRNSNVTRGNGGNGGNNSTGTTY